MKKAFAAGHAKYPDIGLCMPKWYLFVCVINFGTEILTAILLN